MIILLSISYRGDMNYNHGLDKHQALPLTNGLNTNKLSPEYLPGTPSVTSPFHWLKQKKCFEFDLP